jgi:hypothetical protein
MPQLGGPPDSLLESLGGGPGGARSVAERDEERESVQPSAVDVAERRPAQGRFAQVGRWL